MSEGKCFNPGKENVYVVFTKIKVIFGDSKG